MPYAPKRRIMPKLSEYGAKELKKAITANTGKAFIITLCSVLLLIFFNIMSGQETKKDRLPKKPPLAINVDYILINIDEDEPVETPPVVEEIPEPNKQGLLHEIAGDPVPVQDAEISEDYPVFADFENINLAYSTEGDSIPDTPGEYKIPAIEDTIEVVDLDNVEPEEILPPDVFVRHEYPPSYDMQELRRILKYPENARQSGIEGDVHVRVWVSRSGEPLKSEIVKSSSKMLESAALEAVGRLTYSPALQNGMEVGCWLSFKIEFKLR